MGFASVSGVIVVKAVSGDGEIRVDFYTSASDRERVCR